VLLSAGLIATGALWASSGADQQDRTEEAFRAAQHIRRAAESWRRDNADGCPTLSVLKHEAYLEAEAAAEDPWGQRFRIRCGEPAAPTDNISVMSAGRDGKPNTRDDVRVPHFSG
jgi:hypothetical protein